MNKKLDLFEDCTVLRWVKLTKRKPNYNGLYPIRFNGKSTGQGLFINKKLISIQGLSESQFKKYKNTFYWLEEIINTKYYEENCV